MTKYIYGIRTSHVYPITEDELEYLLSGFKWERRRIISRIKRSTKFRKENPSQDEEGAVVDGGS